MLIYSIKCKDSKVQKNKNSKTPDALKLIKCEIYTQTEKWHSTTIKIKTFTSSTSVVTGSCSRVEITSNTVDMSVTWSSTHS